MRLSAVDCVVIRALSKMSGWSPSTKLRINSAKHLAFFSSCYEDEILRPSWLRMTLATQSQWARDPLRFLRASSIARVVGNNDA